VATGDANGDGKSDVAVTANSSIGDVRVLLGTSTGALQFADQKPAGVYPRWIGMADFNGDGKIDVASLGDDHALSIYLGNGDGKFAPRTIWPAGQNTRNGS